MERSGQRPFPPPKASPSHKGSDVSGADVPANGNKNRKKTSPTKVQPVTSIELQRPTMERLPQERKSLEQRFSKIGAQKKRLADKEADIAGKEKTLAEQEAKYQAYRLECLREFNTSHFSQLASGEYAFKCSLTEACKLLNVAIRLLETPVSISHKAKILGQIGGFLHLRMSIRTLIADKKAKAVAPLIARIQSQLCDLCKNLVSSLQTQDSKRKREVIQEVRKALTTDWLTLSRIIISLPEKLLPIDQQILTALELNACYEQFQLIQSNPDTALGFKTAHLHMCRLYILALTQKFKYADRIQKEVKNILEKKSEWLQEYFAHKDLWYQQLIMDTLPTFLSQSEQSGARIKLTDNERAQLYYNLTMSILKHSGPETLELPGEMLNSRRHELNSLEKEALYLYHKHKEEQKVEITRALNFAKQAALSGISSDQQAELRFQFAATAEVMGDMKAAHMHLLFGARRAHSSLHHLYLANSLWIDQRIYPLMPCKALRVWETALKNPGRDNKSLPLQCIKYCCCVDVTRHFVEAIKGELTISTVLTSDQRKLACALKSIRENNYEQALKDLQGCEMIPAILGSLSGFIAVQLIPENPKYLESAFEHFRTACNHSGHEAGLEFAKLAVKYLCHTEEAIKLLKGTLVFLKENDLHEEVEASYLLLEKLHKQLPKPVKEKKTKKAPPKPTHINEKENTAARGQPHISKAPVTDKEPSLSESDSSYESDMNEHDIEENLTDTNPASVTESTAADSDKEPLTVKRLDTINDFILICDFKQAEEMLNNTALSKDKALNGRFWQMRSWLLRQRFRCSEPGPYKVDDPDPNMSHSKSLLNLLDKAQESAETGIRALGIRGSATHDPDSKFLHLMHTREKRALAALYAELGHQYRERGLSTFNAHYVDTGRAMSNLADRLNPNRRNRHHGASQTVEPKVKLVSQEVFASQKESED